MLKTPWSSVPFNTPCPPGRSESSMARTGPSENNNPGAVLWGRGLPNKLARGPKWSSYATAKNYDFALCLLFTFFVWINIIASLILNRTSILKRRPHHNNIIHSYAAPYNNSARRGRAEVARPSCLPKQPRAPARTPISISLWRPITRR